MDLKSSAHWKGGTEQLLLTKVSGRDRNVIGKQSLVVINIMLV